MKKTTILLGALSISLAYGQANQTPPQPTGKVGINTEEPKETLHVKGTFQVEELPAENEKIYKGQTSKTTNFQATKTVVANADGVLGTIPFVIPSGTETKTSLKWDNANNKWIAEEPQVVNANTYTGSTSIELDANAGNSFKRAALTGDVSADKDSNSVSVNKIKGKAISATAPTNGQVLTWEQPQGQQGEWKPKSVVEPWNVMGKTEAATENTQDIYQNGKVGVGDFDDEAKKTHATASLNIKNSGDKDAIRIISDKANTADDLKAEISFRDSAGERYALIGDDKDRQGTYDAARHFYLRTEKNYPLTVGSFGDNEKDRSSIEFMGDAVATNAGNNRGNDVVKMRFFTGRWNDNTNDYGVTTVSKHGNWFIGADMRNKDVPGPNKLTVGGSIRIGDSYSGAASHNGNIGSVPEAGVATDNSNALHKYPKGGVITFNGNFYGTIDQGERAPAGVPSGYTHQRYKWRQLDNIDYEAGKGITITDAAVPNTKIVSIINGTNNGDVLTWNTTSSTWTAAQPTKSPWFVLGTQDSADSSNNNNEGKIYFAGRTALGYLFNNNGFSNFTQYGKLTIDGNPDTDNGLNSHLVFSHSNGRWITSVDTSKYRLSFVDTGVNGDNATNTPVYFLWKDGSLVLKGGTLANGSDGRRPALVAHGSNAGFHYDGANSRLSIKNITATNVLEFKAHLDNTTKRRAQHIDFYRGKAGDAVSNAKSGNIGFGSSSNDIFFIENQTGGDIQLKTSGTDSKTEVTGQLKINTINEGNRGDQILVGNSNIVKRVSLNTLLPEASNGQILQYNNGNWTAGAAPATANEPWFKANNNNTQAQATNTDNTDTGQMYFQGVVGIGADFKNTNLTTNPTSLVGSSEAEKKTTRLVVKGAVVAGSFRGAHGANIFPDYVFQKYYTGNSSIKSNYNFQTLSQVEDFVKANGHLPGYKSAAKIKEQGYIDVMETQLTNVEKIEELYLHSIEQDKALKAKDAEITELKDKNKELEARLERLEKLLK